MPGLAVTQGGVPWREAARYILGCWLICGLGYVVLRLIGDPTLNVAFLVVMVLGQWFMLRHRYWIPGGVAAFAGALTVFALVDLLRQHLEKIAADTLSTAAGATVSLLVFTAASRLARRARPQGTTVR